MVYSHEAKIDAKEIYIQLSDMVFGKVLVHHTKQQSYNLYEFRITSLLQEWEKRDLLEEIIGATEECVNERLSKAQLKSLFGNILEVFKFPETSKVF